jgi:hypothetical protein
MVLTLSFFNRLRMIFFQVACNVRKKTGKARVFTIFYQLRGAG